uniref:Xaa-Pro aminopeptidase 1 n=1 Tax=Magallana gigas TaxID=29159 RepID=K1QTG3_MAGGI
MLQLDSIMNLCTLDNGQGTVIQNYDVEEIKERHRRSVSTDRRSVIRNISPEDRPSCPPGQSEYTSRYDQRRKFICGLSGSAGYAIVTIKKATLWTDGRYFLQAEAEMDCNWILMRKGEKDVPSSTEWLISVLEEIENATVGSYPFFLGSNSWTLYEEELSKNNMKMIKTNEDLVGKIWTTGRPPFPNSPINALPYKFSGRHWHEKTADMHVAMKERNADAMVVNGLDETACRLYIKNHNIKLTSNPTDEATTQKLYEHLNTGKDGSCSGKPGYCVEVREYNPVAVTDKVSSVIEYSKRVWISPICSYAFYSLIPKEKLLQENTPISIQKARKNPIERQGMIQSHVKAGIRWTELSAADELSKYRGKQKYNRGLSFESISSSGPHGAVIHYSPSNVTDKEITTDERWNNRYDKDISFWNSHRFPESRELDILARRHLWNSGLDYRHGTGHGVGMYLGVHEGKT